MTSRPVWKWLRSPFVAFGLLLGVVLSCKGQPGCGDGPHCLDDLKGLDICQLLDLFTHADLNHPFVGVAKGRLLVLTDDRLPKLKVKLANQVWRGKAACEDGYFINRWIANYNWIDSHYVIGPSWVDGRPAVVMEYAPGTPLFAPMHDELREISPGLYIGPVYERYPCVKLRGFIGLQMEPCKTFKGCCH
jgi:hypothetical protein